MAALASEGRKVFTTADAERVSGNPGHARKALSRLEDKGWVDRLARGRYMLIPIEAGVDRYWAEDSLAIGSFLASDGAVAYWSAIRAWGWTTQLPSTVFLITPRQVLRPTREVLGVRYQFVRIKQERLFGLTQLMEGSLAVRVTDKERTVIDMMDRPDLCGGVGEVAAALTEGWTQLNEERLMQYVHRHGGGTVPKRLGYLVETLGLAASEHMIRFLLDNRGKGFTKLDRGGPDSGRLLTRWNLRVNAVIGGPSGTGGHDGP